MCQEVGVTEHVLLIHHEAEEGKLGVVNVKDKLLEEPDGVEAVVSCGREHKTQPHHSRVLSGGRQKAESGLSLRVWSLTYNICLVLAVVILGTANLHLHKRAHDAPPVLGQVPGTKDLWEKGEEEEGEV